jgi:hypothetical protein
MKTWRAIVATAFVGLLAGLGTSQAADFSSWGKRMSLQFTGYSRSEMLTNFPALVVLGTNLSGFSYADFVSGTNADLRFTDASLTNELNYEIEKWDTNGSSYVWVRVPQLTSGANLYAFWGMSSQAAPAYTTNGAVWDSGFKGSWHLNETAFPYRDSTSNRIHGTSGTAPASVPGYIGGGQLFTSTSSQFIDLSSNVFSDTSFFTIAAWVKPVGGGTAVGRGRDGSGTGWSASLSARTGAVHTATVITMSGGAAGYSPAGMTTIGSSNRWDHLTAVWRPQNGGLTFYVNGVQEGTNATTTYTLRDSTVGVRFGRVNDGYYSGALDEVQISNIARSSNWIWACYMNQGSNNLFGTYSDAVAGGSPVIRTDPATNVTTTSASLNGYLMSTGTSDTAIFAYYGPADGGTNAANWAFTNASLTASQAVGAKSVSVSLPAGSEIYYRFAASNAAGVAWASASQYLITTNVTVSATPAVVGESNELVRFAFARPAAFTNRALTVNFAITGGSASNGWDYTASATSVTLPAGVAAATTTVATTLLDGLTEGDETIGLTVAADSCAGGAPSPAIATITNTPMPVYTATANTLVLQQGARVTLNGLPYNLYTNTVDTYIDRANPTISYGSAAVIKACGQPSPYQGSTRGYLTFGNLQNYVPSNAVVLTARIDLTSAGDGAGNEAGIIYYRTAAWSPTSTWNSPPADGQQQIGSIERGPWAGWAADAVAGVDVSAVAQAWLRGTIANNGLLLSSQEGNTTYTERNFYSSDYATVGKRPKLTIVYAVTNAPVTPVGYERFWPVIRKVVALSGSSIIQDTFVNGDDATTKSTSYATATTVNLRTRNSQGVKRALLKINTTNSLLATFKPSTGPTNRLDKRLVSAKLLISVPAGFSVGNPSLWTCNQPWDPATATFNTRDGVTPWNQVWATDSSQNIGSLVGAFVLERLPFRGGSAYVDITSTLQAWINGTANNGFVIGQTYADYDNYLALTEFAVPALRPTLILEYYDLWAPGGTVIVIR